MSRLSVYSRLYTCDGPRTLNSTRRHFLNLTCDARLSDMRYGGKQDSDTRHGYFLNSTCDMVENKRQRHATLPLLKVDMRHRDHLPPPPSRAVTSEQCTASAQAAFHLGPGWAPVGPRLGPGWAPVGQSWAPNGPRMGLTGAHLAMLLGWCTLRGEYLL